jgi:hypothetical protein
MGSEIGPDSSSGEKRKNDGTGVEQYLIAEYNNLTRYFSTVITFRFTTASFFIAAVALFLGLKDASFLHYLLLFLLAIGIWIVELRNRAIFHNLLERGWAIEKNWADHDKGDLPFLTHMTPVSAAKKYPSIPREARVFDKTRILWSPRFSGKYLTHTVGLDIVYISVLAFSLWSLLGASEISLGGLPMPIISGVLGLLVVFGGINLMKASLLKEGKTHRVENRLLTGGALITVFGLMIIVYSVSRK